MIMKLEHNGQTIALDEAEQSMVYEFYVFNCTKERMHDWMDEQDIELTFKDDNSENAVVNRIINIKNDYHVPEDDAIQTVFDDTDFMSVYTDRKDTIS